MFVFSAQKSKRNNLIDLTFDFIWILNQLTLNLNDIFRFRFGILAFRCTNCKVFVHHDCKSQLKTSLKSRQLAKGVQKHCISDYVPEVGPSVPALIVHCVNEVSQIEAILLAIQ